MAKKRPTVAEKKWMQQVADYGCIACHKDGLNVPAEIHHIRKHTGMGLRPSHFDTIPLCSGCHRTNKISVHLGKREFERRYGTEQEILEKVNREIERCRENQDIL